MRLMATGVVCVLAVTMSSDLHGQGKPADVNGTMTFRCAFGGGCPEGDALVSDEQGVYAEDPTQDTFVFLSKEGRLQFRLSNEQGTRGVYLNLAAPEEVICSSGPHCYAYPGTPGWVSSFGRDGGQATVVTPLGSDVKNGLYSLAIGTSAPGRFVVNWDDPEGDMRWGLAFRGADQTLRIRRDDNCTWTISAGDGGAEATAVLSAWPKIKRAYTEVPQATYEIPFSMTFTTCP